LSARELPLPQATQDRSFEPFHHLTPDGLLFDRDIRADGEAATAAAAAAGFRVSRIQSDSLRSPEAASQAARSSNVTRRPSVLLTTPLGDLAFGPRPPNGHPVPRASAGSTSWSWRLPPV